MATFSAQVVDLVGAFTDETALDTWITEGANEIINAMPRAMRERVAEETQFTASAEVEGHNVLHVLRSDGTIEHPCRRVPAGKRGVIQDSTHIEYASATYPAFIEKDATIIVYPTPANNNGKLVSIPTYNQGSPLDASDISAITNFPNEAEYLVTLYAAIKALQQNMSGKLGNSDIAAALVLINTELDETQAVCDLVNTQVDSAVTALSNMATEIALANKEVDDALIEIDEAVGLTDGAGSNIQVAVDAMKTANAKFRADGGDPALFGDESTYTTGNSAMTSVKTYVDRAISYINGDFPAAAYDLAANLADVDAELTSEDIELASARVQQVQTTLNATQADLQIAQMYITEWNTMVQTLVAEVNAFSTEASARYGWMSTKAVVWQGELAAAQGYMATAGGYASQASGFNAAAQGYANEIQAKIGIANGYIAEINARLSVDSAEYAWYEKQQIKLQQDYDKGVAILRGGG